MKQMILMLAAASLCLASCATTSRLPATAQVDQAIDAAQARYDQLRGWVALFLPYMPPAWQERVRLAGRSIELALATAQTAATIADRKAALAQATAATAALAHATGN